MQYNIAKANVHSLEGGNSTVTSQYDATLPSISICLAYE